MNKPESFYIIRVSAPRPGILNFSGNFKNKTDNFQLDPGAARCFISKNLIKTIEEIKISKSEEISMKIANCGILKSTELIEM